MVGPAARCGAGGERSDLGIAPYAFPLMLRATHPAPSGLCYMDSIPNFPHKKTDAGFRVCFLMIWIFVAQRMPLS